MCPSINLSVCVHAHAHMKRSIASKFDTDIRVSFWEDFESIFLKIDQEFLKHFLKIFFSDFVQAIFLFQDFFASMRGTQYLQSTESWYRDTKERFWEDLEAIFS